MRLPPNAAKNGMPSELMTMLHGFDRRVGSVTRSTFPDFGSRRPTSLAPWAGNQSVPCRPQRVDAVVRSGSAR